jgi:hypothetical protein
VTMAERRQGHIAMRENGGYMYVRPWMGSDPHEDST